MLFLSRICVYVLRDGAEHRHVSVRLLKRQRAIFLLPTVCLILIKQQKTKTKSLSALHRRSFVALIRNKGSLILTVKTTLFYFTFDYSISIVGC